MPEKSRQFVTLVDIIARLRAPDGCPWDRRQTHASLREHLLAECYEVLEAIDKGDPPGLCEELGDLLLQILLHAQIAADTGEFGLGDVIKGINDKLVHRHPHVFGTRSVRDAEEVAHNWDTLKREEREDGSSILDGVPKQMPALSYSYEVQKRVARVGFDWEDIGGILDKLAEEVGEFELADSQEQKAGEFGDLLFTLVNLARRHGIDSEAALREANRKFFRRFSCMEVLCRQRGVKFDEMTFDEQNVLWEEAKKVT